MSCEKNYLKTPQNIHVTCYHEHFYSLQLVVYIFLYLENQLIQYLYKYCWTNQTKQPFLTVILTGSVIILEMLNGMRWKEIQRKQMDVQMDIKHKIETGKRVH